MASTPDRAARSTLAAAAFSQLAWNTASVSNMSASKAFLGPTDLQPSFCVGAVRCIDAARLELMRLYSESTEAQRSDQDGWEQIQLSLREFARQWADLRPDLANLFSTRNDGLLGISRLTWGVGHIEGAHENRFPQGMLAQVAERLDAIGMEFAAMYAAASGAKRPEVGERIRVRLRELLVQAEEDNQPGPHSCADASVGTDDFEVDAPDGQLERRPTVGDVLATLDSGIASTIEPRDGLRKFDVQNDLARMVCRRSAAALAIRLRWVCIAICMLGAAVPVLMTFVVHWASGGLGQFAPAYEWPLWFDLWSCVGWWLVVCVQPLLYASMQREIAWMALKQVSTL
jgi:hypothetical protein